MASGEEVLDLFWTGLKVIEAAEIVAQVAAFADPVITGLAGLRWDPALRSWR